VRRVLHDSRALFWGKDNRVDYEAGRFGRDATVCDDRHECSGWQTLVSCRFPADDDQTSRDSMGFCEKTQRDQLLLPRNGAAKKSPWPSS
jgi:hypothetical protein